ncbi:bifunctional methylenetetrahydrofolate dehydrogenase/methenyltetrahydrofolate cyclohydrolase FolD [Fulvimarina pelagi]|nr:bifunctional methylenetetrahydrofolate dehydrogenase/methenyltetrahydrofolate cyclohydrolase FolD [Fulvimarina pelagi]BAT31239.1 bifunctional 5,10-methylene-tetrahydrofolate dehydrogenase/ 5,10-methylene-tetrahydrofolate cyclohydrolase [Fulvimarina pelagi]
MSDTTIMDGKGRSKSILEEVTEKTKALKAETGMQPGLAVVIVGSDPASQVYVGSKAKRAEECGFKSVKHELPAETSEADLLKIVDDLNKDDTIHGILVQLPLPKQIDDGKVIQAIDPDKDVDGFHLVNVGRIATGAADEAFVPCTPAGCMVMIRDMLGEDLSGLNAVIVGRSNIVGKPMAQLLLAANATVTIAHSRTKNLAAVCANADILVAAVGRPEMVTGDYVKEGAVVVDVGINRVDAPEKGMKEDGSPKTRLVGDVAYDEAAKKAKAITPVPGGVGPMTIGMLMANTLRSAYRAAGKEAPKF